MGVLFEVSFLKFYPTKIKKAGHIGGVFLE